MMKKLTLLLALILVFSSSMHAPAFAAKQVESEKQNVIKIDQFNDGEVEANNLVGRFAWKIFLSTLGTYIALPQSSYIEVHKDFTTSSSGSVRLNSNGNSSSIEKVENVRGTNNRIDMWAITINPLHKLTLMAIAPNGRKQDMPATTSQRMWVDPTKLGNAIGDYNLYYVDHKTVSWNAYSTHYHFENRFVCTDTSKPCPIPANDSDQMENDGLTEVKSFKDGTTKKVDIVQVDDLNLIKPSKAHVVSNKIKEDNKYTFSELLSLRFDIETGEIVMNFRGLSVGDEVIVNDVIVDLDYDPQLDRTLLGFNGLDEGLVETIPFKGNLEKLFSIGDEINLKFEIVQFKGSGLFEATNLEKVVLEDDVLPEIEDYIVR